jgi:Fic family protein
MPPPATGEPDKTERAGLYVRQPMGYRAYIPRPLPPQPPVEITDGRAALLARADRATGRLDGALRTLPVPCAFANMYLRGELVRANWIDGGRASLDDLLASARLGQPLDATSGGSDLGGVRRSLAAIAAAHARLGTVPVSEQLAAELHRELLSGPSSGADAGKLRRSQTSVGLRAGLDAGPGASLATAAFVPPPPAEIWPAMQAWERFVRQTDSVPHLIRIALAHAQFETIHPFLEANARVGRLLTALLFSERGLVPQPVLHLSHYLHVNATEGFERLERVRNVGDWEGWVDFFLIGVAVSAEAAATTAARVVELRERHRAAVADHFGRATSSALAVLESLAARPIVTVADVVAITKTTFPAANELVSRFVRLGVLSEITGQPRHRRFRYDDYVELFSEPRTQLRRNDAGEVGGHTPL